MINKNKTTNKGHTLYIRSSKELKKKKLVWFFIVVFSLASLIADWESGSHCEQVDCFVYLLI